MKHGKKGRKFNRTRDQRKALLKNLAVNLILKEKIKTTEAKAKSLRSYVEKLITKSKKNDLATVRYLNRYLPAQARKKIISQLGPQYKDRQGGYTRITKLGARTRDRAKMVIIELIK